MTQLREKSQIILWTLLFFFIASMTVGGLVGGANIMSLIVGGKNLQLHMGKVGKKNITRSQFEFELRNQIALMRRQNRAIDSRSQQNASNSAWNNIIERVLKDQKIEELGLEVSTDEIYDFLFITPPPAFQNDLMSAGFFANDENNFDLESYQAAVQNGALPEVLDPQLLNWENYLRTWLADRKLRNILNSLGSVSDEMVKTDYIHKNLNCTIDYIYVNLNDVPDSLIKINDDVLLEKYHETKKDNYSTKETRTAEYIIWEFPPQLTEEDSANASTIQDSLTQTALEFLDESDYSSFNEALSKFNLVVKDTIDIHESFESNSGIPFQMGVFRSAVRFAFDNPIGSISDPLNAENGLVIFHILDEKDAGIKPFEEVKENLRRTLMRDHKKEYIKDLLVALDTSADWKSIADGNSLVQFNSNESQTISSSFPKIGKSNELTGTLRAMNSGQTSHVIETYNAATIVRMIDKDEFDDEKYLENYEAIRSSLLSAENNQGYSQWLNNAKDMIETEDYRSEIY